MDCTFIDIDDKNKIRVVVEKLQKDWRHSIGIIIDEPIPISDINEAFKTLDDPSYVASNFINDELIEEYGNPNLKVNDFYIFGGVSLTMIYAIEFEFSSLSYIDIIVDYRYTYMINKLLKIKGKKLTLDDIDSNLSQMVEEEQKYIILNKEILEQEISYEKRALIRNYKFLREVEPLEYLLEAVKINNQFIPIAEIQID